MRKRGTTPAKRRARTKSRTSSVMFRGCKLFGSVPCSNGANEGEIQRQPAEGRAGLHQQSRKKVGVLLEPAKKHGEFAKFDCARHPRSTAVWAWATRRKARATRLKTTAVYDGIISPITPVNTMTTQLHAGVHRQPGNDENIPSKFEGKHIELLERLRLQRRRTAEQPAVVESWRGNHEREHAPKEEGEIKA